MKHSFYGKSFYIKVTILMLIGLCSLFGMYLLTLYTTFFNIHKFLTPISVPANFKIDFFGAIFPLFVGLACVAVYLRYGFLKINYFVCFLFSLAIAFLISQVTAEGLMSSPGIFSIWVSIVVVFLATFFRKLKKKSIWEFKESYIASLLVASSCAPLSKIIVDLYYVGIFSNAVIGGNGLADGVLLSIMYSPLAVTFITSLFVLSLQVYSQKKLKTNLSVPH
jgi:hypothetical protein